MKFSELIGTVVLLAAAVFFAQFVANKLARRTSTVKDAQEVVTPAHMSVEEFLDRY